MKLERAVQNLLLALIVLVSLASLFFGLWLELYIFNTPLHQFLGLVMLALTGLNAFFNISGAYYFVKARDLPAPVIPALKGHPSVTFIVPFRNEPRGIVLKTLKPLLEQDYPRDKVQVLVYDNSDQPDLEVKSWCARHAMTYRFVVNPVKMKSWVVIEALKEAKGEYTVTLDADDVLFDKKFLSDNIALLQTDASLSLVQCRKSFAKSRPFGDLVNAYYGYFFQHIQPVRGADRSAMWCGSQAVLRTQILREIGLSNHLVEDTEFSFKADLSGHGCLYNPKLYAYGEPVGSYTDLLAQQWRYTLGNTAMVKLYLERLGDIRGARRHLHYLSQMLSFFYLSYPFVIYAFIAIFFVLLNLTTNLFVINTVPRDETTLISLGYAGLVMLMTLAGAKLYFGSLRQGVAILLLNVSVCLIRAKGIFLEWVGKATPRWGTVRKRSRLTLGQALKLTWPDTLIVLTAWATAVLSFVSGDIVSTVWLVWHGALFSSALVVCVLTDVTRTI